MPHPMKKFFPIVVVAFAALFLNSCLEGDYQSTPRISVYALYRTNPSGVKDTLRFGDTIQVGDTVLAPMLLEGMYNELVYFKVSADTSLFDYILVRDTTNAHLLASDSKPEEGYLHFVSGCYLYPAMLRYVAKKSGTYPIHVELGSTANEKYSPVKGYFNQTVK